MKTFLLPRGSVAAVIVAFSVSLSLSAEPTRPGTLADKIHVILIADVNDSTLGSGFNSNLNFVSRILGEIPRNQGTSTVVTSQSQLTSAYLLSTVNNLATSIGPNDVVFCYIAMHGGYPSPGTEAEHFFECNDTGAIIRRQDLLNALNPNLGQRRLVVLISDSCCTPVPRPGSARARATFRAAAVAPPVTAALCHLLQETSGVVDINAATKDQAAVYLVGGAVGGTDGGGMFTRSLWFSAFTGPSTSWGDFLTDATARMKQNFGSIWGPQGPFLTDLGRNQPSQTPFSH